MPVEIKSPYNFVPLNEKVFFPPWAKYVSQDVPLTGALSGSIDLEITTATPLFIRGEETEKSKERSDEHHIYDFFEHNGNYCIPGSSLKGMLNSLVGIFGFGKIGPINDVRYSQRDWSNSKIYDKSIFQNVKGGWLSRDEEGNYSIKYSTDKLGRIAHWHIDSEFSTQWFDRDFKSPTFQQNDDEYKAAKKKYDLFERTGGKIDQYYPFKEEPELYIEKSKTHYYSISNAGNKTGRLVFTGQPGTSSYEKGNIRNKKYSEFIFWEPTKTEEINHLMIKDFLWAYLEHDPGNRKPDWNFWREELQEGKEVPVFLTLDKKNRIKHFGLSKLYKLPFENSVGKLMDDDHHSPEYDLAETIFGTPSVTNGGHKGRVAIHNAYAPENTFTMEEKTLVLSQPKASFYPFYVEQDFRTAEIIKGNYNTYNDLNAKIKGRKYYPVKSVTGNALKDQLSTSFKPVPRNTLFKGKIVYHNLLPQELGALQCALTMNDTEAMHSLGMAKPFGYGAVRIEVKDFEISRQNSAIENEEEKEKTFWSSLFRFRETMQDFYKQGEWKESQPIYQLLAMAGKKHNPHKLGYMTLSINPRQNDYADAKENPRQALPRFTDFLDIPPEEIPIPPSASSPFAPLEAVFEAEKIAQKAKEELLEKKLVAAAEKEKRELKEREKQRKIDAGLREHLSFVQKDYTRLSNGIESWLLHNTVDKLTNQKDVDIFLDMMMECLNNKKPKFRKGWLNDNKRGDIVRWAGEDALKQFEEMINNQ